MAEAAARNKRSLKLARECLEPTCAVSNVGGQLVFERTIGVSFWHLQCDTEICMSCLGNAILRRCYSEEA
jgi:hypothetical protein